MKEKDPRACPQMQVTHIPSNFKVQVKSTKIWSNPSIFECYCFKYKIPENKESRVCLGWWRRFRHRKILKNQWTTYFQKIFTAAHRSFSKLFQSCLTGLKVQNSILLRLLSRKQHFFSSNNSTYLQAKLKFNQSNQLSQKFVCVLWQHWGSYS